MIVTPVEASLAALLVAVVSGVLIPLWRGRKYVTCTDCDKRHTAEQEACDKQHADDKEARQVLYRMVRALVIHSDMSAEEKEKVLNDRGVDS